MRRREFLGVLGAAAMPLAGRAQQRPLRRVAMLMPMADDDAEAQARMAAFLQSFQQLGWSVGHNVQLEIRWAGTSDAGIRKHAAELATLAPDVILATGGVSVGPLQQVNRRVPVVFVQVTDPVGAGYVESLARPGGNATGFIPFEYGTSGKWL